jgi:hypothetical protein
MDTAFEQQAAQVMADAAGPEIALDVRDLVAELSPELMIVDCMLPAGIAAGEATRTPTVSLVHFPYGLGAGTRTGRRRAATAPAEARYPPPVGASASVCSSSTNASRSKRIAFAASVTSRHASESLRRCAIASSP